MVLGEKITELRKRSGLSQEQFGDKIGVSRQAVSKWEMSQTTPDLSKIVAVAEFFGVSTDFLLKDELGMSDLDAGSTPVASEASPTEKHAVALEEVQSYLASTRTKTRGIIISIILFFLSPVTGIFLSLTGSDMYPIIGAMVEVIVLIIAVVILILAIKKTSGFSFLKSSDSELAYGVKGVVEEYKSSFDHTHLLGIIIGVILLIASVLPMTVCSFFTETNDLLTALCAVIMLIMIASGISSIVYVSLINHSFKRILKLR